MKLSLKRMHCLGKVKPMVREGGGNINTGNIMSLISASQNGDLKHQTNKQDKNT